MIWKDRKSNQKKTYEFTPANLEESIKYIKNPFQGWYTLYSFAAEETINEEQLQYCLKESESIVLVQWDIGAYYDKALDIQAFQHLANILAFFKKQEKDVIFRPVYDREGNGIEREPKVFDLVLQHLEQIGIFLQNEEHTVFLFQGLLIGSWGEMHTSNYLEADQLQRLYQTISSCLGNDIPVAVRTPLLWRTLVQETAYQNGKVPKLGLFHDALFSSGTDLGTYGVMTKEAAGWQGAWIRSEELQFSKAISENVIFGGEALLTEEGFSLERMLKEANMLQLSYLNSAYDKRLLDLWKETMYQDNMSYYEYVGAYMGCRFVISNPVYEKEQGFFSKKTLQFTVKNVGFATAKEDIYIDIFIEHDKGTTKIHLEENLKEMKCKESKKIIVPMELTEGTIYVKAYTKRNSRPFFFANKNSEHLKLGVLS